jgi:O-antigen/teichoic acid export membrane protein
VLHFSASSQLLLWLFLASTIVALLLSICWHRRALPRQVLVAQPQFDTGHWAHVLIPLIMISTLAVLEIQINVLMIGPLVSTKDAGIYSAAMRLSTLAIFGFMAVNTIAAPMFSQLHANGEHHQLQRLLTLSARGLAAFTIPVCAVLILFGKPLLMLFGKEFVRAYPVLVILTASHLIDVLSGSVGFLLTMTGHQGTAARMMLLRVAIHVTLGAMLIPRFEMVGAAWALLVASVTWNLVMVVCVRKLLNLDSTMFSIFRRP